MPKPFGAPNSSLCAGRMLWSRRKEKAECPLSTQSGHSRVAAVDPKQALMLLLSTRGGDRAEGLGILAEFEGQLSFRQNARRNTPLFSQPKESSDVHQNDLDRRSHYDCHSGRR